jgi:hypothetical protein
VSRNRRIGGQLDLAAYERMAQRYRARDAESLAAEARRLHRGGHSPGYIADTLQMPLDIVTQAIAEQALK